MLKVLINILITSIVGIVGIGEEGEVKPQEFLEPTVAETGESVAGVWEVKAPVRINEESRGVKISARSALAVDKESGEVLFEKEPDVRLPIASISKLMTVLVFLETEPDWEKQVWMVGSDYVGGAAMRLGTGESLTVKDLFYVSLVNSANNAITALVRSTGIEEKDFMILMNKKAQELGMKDTYFAEATGLNMVNHSTARDIVKLMKASLDNEMIVEALGMKDYSFRTINTGRWVKVKNTDKLLSSFLNDGDGYKILGGKTGYNLEAGYCLTVGIQGQEEQKIVAVILGAKSNEARFQETKGMVWWVFENWRWR